MMMEEAWVQVPKHLCMYVVWMDILFHYWALEHNDCSERGMMLNWICVYEAKK